MVSSRTKKSSASTNTSVAVRFPSAFTRSWDEWSLHSTLKADSDTDGDETYLETAGVSPQSSHSERCGGVLTELKFAASMNQSLTIDIVHSFVSRMLRRVSFGSSPTREMEYRGG
jgi:hypothetical protein